MFKSYLSIAATAVLTIALTTGCSDNDDFVEPTTPVDLGYNGLLLAPTATAGASYICGENVGITDADGVFGPCPTGSVVRFALGTAVLGDATPTSETHYFVTTNDIVPAVDAQAAPSRALSQADFAAQIGSTMMSLDADGNPENGCGIDALAAESFAAAVEESGGSFSALDPDALAQTLAETTSKIAEVDPDAAALLVPKSPEDAKVLQEETDTKIEAGEITPPPPVELPPVTGA
jgi:hypothetical protein